MELFIDTHSELITLAIRNQNKIYSKEKISERSHSEYTLPLLNELFVENGFVLRKIKRIIVINGPGSFTGIRIGLSIAKTLAYTLGIEIITLSSLRAYLVSSDINEDRMCVIEDGHGYYVSALDKNNKELVKESYIEELLYDYKVVENKLNLENIFRYAESLEPSNCHFVKANYIKKIEVEND